MMRDVRWCATAPSHNRMGLRRSREMHYGSGGTGEPDRWPEQIGVVIALIGRLAGARALSRPQARQAILLAKACFVLEPDPTGGSYMHLLFFLNA